VFVDVTNGRHLVRCPGFVPASGEILSQTMAATPWRSLVR